MFKEICQVVRIDFGKQADSILEHAIASVNCRDRYMPVCTYQPTHELPKGTANICEIPLSQPVIIHSPEIYAFSHFFLSLRG